MDLNKDAERDNEICTFCYDTFGSSVHEESSSDVQKLNFHRSCARHINPEHLDATFLNWEDTMPLPLCSQCVHHAQKLSKLDEKLEIIQAKINECVKDFTDEFLASRKNKSKPSNYSTIGFGTPNCEFEIKEEPEETIDSYDDYGLNDDDGEESYSGYHLGEEEMLPSSQVAETIVRRKHFVPPNTRFKPQGGPRTLEEIGPKSVRISLRRIKIDVDGNPIPDPRQFLRRKAAIKAESTFSTWIGQLSGRRSNARDSENEEWNETSNGSKNNLKSEMKTKMVKKFKRGKVYGGKPQKSVNKNASSSKCKICGSMFSTSSKLKTHLQLHREGRPFICPECNFPFKSSDSLKRHQEAHSSERAFKCGHCKKSYKYRRNLKDHVKVMGHHENPDAQCELCEKALHKTKKMRKKDGMGKKSRKNSPDDSNDNSTEDGSLSMKSDGTETDSMKAKKQFSCEYCKKLFPSSYKLKMHTRIHTEEKNISCDICTMRFYDQHSLRRHRETHIAERQYKCDYCEKSYKYRRNVKEHIIKHHPEKSHLLEGKDVENSNEAVVTKYVKKRRIKEEYKCTDCDEEFKDRVGLICHKYSHRPPGTEIACEDCNATQVDLIQLRHHMLTHSKEQKFLCSFCGNPFKTHTSKMEHEILHYNLSEEEIKEKYFPCIQCQRIFISSSRLKIHSVTHSKDRPFGPCDVCGATFKTIRIFKSHQRIHHADKNQIQCSVCEKMFSSRGCLNRHMYLHGNEKLFACFCGKKFSTKSGLTAHSVYHKGEKPYLCEECGQGFYTGTKLREHYRIHTGMLLYCEFCSKGFKNSTLLKQHHQVHNKPLIQRSKRVRKNAASVKPRGRKTSVQKPVKFNEVVYEEIEGAVDQVVHFQCSICDELCTNENDISTHMESHTIGDTHAVTGI